jgi:hypothetical protein
MEKHIGERWQNEQETINGRKLCLLKPNGGIDFFTDSPISTRNKFNEAG